MRVCGILGLAEPSQNHQSFQSECGRIRSAEACSHGYSRSQNIAPKMVVDSSNRDEPLVSSGCAPPARAIGAVTISAQLAFGQRPKDRLILRTTRLPRYFAMSMAGISFRLA